MNESNKFVEKLEEYFNTLYSNLLDLIFVNILFIISCIPIITAGSALVALFNVVCSIIRGKKLKVFEEYTGALKQYFLVGLYINISFLPCFAVIIVYMVKTIRIIISSGFNPSNVIPFILFFFLCSISAYFLCLFLTMDARFGAVVKNTFLLCFANGIRSVLCGVISGSMLVAGLCTYPYSFPVFLLILFSLAAYTSCFFSWQAASKYIFSRYYQFHPEEVSDYIQYITEEE